MTLPHRLGALLLALALAATPALADQNLFVVDLASDPASLDPQVQWDPDSYTVYRNIFDNLVARNAAGRIVPQVATSWAYKSDTKIVFQIRGGIRFQDGTELTPADVVFGFRRITDPAFKARNSASSIRSPPPRSPASTR